MNIMEKNKIIIGVSGGPDSIYLLNKIFLEKKFIPIVAHVNYHFRKESDDEQIFVEKFCKEKKIDFFVKNVEENDLKMNSYSKNKQSIARKIRYDFYFLLAKKFNTQNIYVAHHKDDFIETAIMQEKRSKENLFYGLKQVSYYKNFIINRPLLNMYKSEIISKLIKNKIDYKLDLSNFEGKYERNIIRMKLAEKKISEKENIYKKYISINRLNEEKYNCVIKIFNEFKNNDYDWIYFNKIEESLKKYVVYKWLIDLNEEIKISMNKIKGIIIFLVNNRGNKFFRIKKNLFIIVKDKKIYLTHKDF